MRDDLLLGTAKGRQAEEGVQDGQSGGRDVSPQIERTVEGSNVYAGICSSTEGDQNRKIFTLS